MPTTLQDMLRQYAMPAAAELSIALEPGDNQAAPGAVQCVACGHRCRIAPGHVGVCRVRFNEGGRILAPAGYIAGLQADPIEKKPFFHAFPGATALSFGMLGCDFHCAYCQNWVSSQALRDESAVAQPQAIGPAELVELAVRHDARVVVSTYNEPLITADWAMQVFRPARERGLVCGFVSNGNATPEVLAFIRPCVDLYKVDLKCFDDRRYRKLGGTLSNVLDTIVRLRDMGFWVELVTLVVPGFNDGAEELRSIARFIASVSPDIPWHVTAFHPDYRMADPPPTSADNLLRAWDAGREAGLHFVYRGNLPGRVGDGEDTHCPRCRAKLIGRRGFHVLENRMKAGQCSECQADIPGRWN
jgi:pyruvate formate lyase activating enzyme